MEKDQVQMGFLYEGFLMPCNANLPSVAKELFLT